jgi:hypothetical protein
MTAGFELIVEHPLIEEILGQWREQIGAQWSGYRGHVYRMFNCCLALRACSTEETTKLAVAAAFHDLGLWSDQTVDYLPPSSARAAAWLQSRGLPEWVEEIRLIIDNHHKLRTFQDERWPLVEVFRQADLVDFSLHCIRFGMAGGVLRQLRNRFPNAGFHWFLAKTAAGWFLRHPLSPPPFLRW